MVVNGVDFRLVCHALVVGARFIVLDFLVSVLLMVAQKFPVDRCDAIVAGVIAWADLSAVGVVTVVAVVRALLLI